jgi:hypothetical protein
MPDDETGIVDDILVVPVRCETATPLWTRNIDQQAAAVTFTIDAPGAVHHHLKPDQRLNHHASVRLSITGDEGCERTRIVFD